MNTESSELPDYEALKEELSRIKLVMDATLEGWWEWDMTTNIAYHSPQWYKMLGYNKESWTASKTSWQELLHPDDLKIIPALQDEKIKEGKQWELEFRMRCVDGTYKWILSKGNIVRRSAEGKPEKVVGIHIDLTGKKELERLKESYTIKEELLNGIIRVSSADDAVYEFVKKRIACSLQLGHRIFQYSYDELEKLTNAEVEELIHPADKDKIAEHWVTLMGAEYGQMTDCVFRIKGREGEYIWVQTTDSVYSREEQLHVIRIVGTSIDIQNLIDMKSKIEQDIKFLETIAFENSHMVRGPVSSILGLVELIKKNHVQSDIDKQLVEYLERAVVKMDTVIRAFSDNINEQLMNKKK